MLIDAVGGLKAVSSTRYVIIPSVHEFSEFLIWDFSDLGHLNDENLNLVYPAGSHLSKILDKVSGVSIFFFEFKPKPNYCIGSRFLS